MWSEQFSYIDAVLYLQIFVFFPPFIQLVFFVVFYFVHLV